MTDKPAQASKHEKKPGSLRRQVLLFLSLLLLPFSILSAVLGLNTMSSLQQQYIRQTQAVLDSYTSHFEHRINTADYLLLNLFRNNDDLLRFERNTGDWHHVLYRSNLSSSMNEALVLSGSADGIFILLNSSDELIHAGHFQFGPSSMRKMDETALRSVISDPAIRDGKWHLVRAEEEAYLIHILNDAASRYGAYISCSAYLSTLNTADDLYEETLYVTDQVPSKEPGTITLRSRIRPTDAALVSSVRSASVYGRVLLWVLISALLIVFSCLTIPLFLFAYHWKIDQPLAILKQAFHELESGNETYRITRQATSEEFFEAYQSFNSMAFNLSALQKQVLEEEQQRHHLAEHNLNLQLDNLQLQIRPHFLQNTMNLLFTLIHNGQSDNAERLVLYLSKYFRYMFRHGHDLELFSKEMEMVREYLEISEMHYENAFTVSYQIDPVLSFLRIPPLLLHNFVENIIQHALIPGSTVHIILYGEYDDEQKMAILQVSDDGNGISAEYADRINRNDFSDLPAGKHIGVRNSINRLHYYFGEKASVTVDSAEGEGTTFTIRIPCNLTEEDEA